MSTDFDLPVRDLKRLHRYTYWTLVGSGPFGLVMALLFLASEIPEYRVLLWITLVLMVASVGLATAVMWLFVEGRGRKYRRWLLWIGWGVVAVGFGAGLLEAPAPAAWIVPAALLEAARMLTTGSPRSNMRRTGYSFAAAMCVVIVLVALGGLGSPAPFFTIFIVPSIEAGVVCQWWFYRVAARLDEARGLAGELAVAEERLRFAAELHDIQGGHLQAIILKTQLARRLGRSDPGRAETELEAVEELARQALRDTRAVVSGYRRVSLSEEVDSAARVLRSAGIDAAVRTDSHAFDERTEYLLGLLVREATTNILRHASAGEAELAVGVDGERVTARVANDGAGDAEGPTGNGIAMLAERFEEAGGSVEHRRGGGAFTLTGTLPLRPEEAS